MKVRSERIFRKYTYSFVFGAADTSKTAAIDPTLGMFGAVAKIIVTLPDWTNTVDSTVSLNNEDSKEVFVTYPMGQNLDFDITLCRNECLIVGQEGEEWQVALSGAPGGSGGTATITAYVER